jgi:hypothetical protein
MKPIEHFVKSLSRLNEKKFFEISRNLLGDVRTPYHKQTVIERLISCISNAALQEVLFSYVTEDEALIINAVELLNGPSLHDIHDFLVRRFSYAECIRLVILLEERLIFYSYVDFGQEYYALNPVFERKLKPILDNKSVLFPCVKKSGMWRTETLSLTINKMFLFAFLSYAHSGKIQLKVNNTLTKKTESQIAAFLQDDDFFHSCFFNLLNTLLYLDLLSIAEKACAINMPAIELFFKRSEKECRVYFTAGMCGDKKYAGFVMDFLAALSPETYYAPSAVFRMLMVIFRKSTLDFPPPFDMLLRTLKRTGLLIDVTDPETGEKYHALSPDYAQSCDQDYGKNDTSFQDTHSQNAPIPIVFDAPFSFVVLPNADAASLLDLLHFSSVENLREYRFTINKETVVRCLENGKKGVKGAPEKNAAWIIERLNTLSGGRLDETLVWTVNEWEKRFGEVILHEGLVLYLDNERRYLAETASLKPYLEKALTENVFVINPVYRETVENLLAKSGVDIIGKVSFPQPAENNDKKYVIRTDVSFPPLPEASHQKVMFSPAFFAGEQKPHEPPVPAVDYRKKFHAVLASLNAAEAEKQELLSRIDRGLIFCEEQLKKLSLPGTFPYEKNKAHGMDYSGKLLIAKSALVNGIPVEITWQTGGKEKSMVCRIASIAKNESGDVLVVSNDDLHGTMDIPLGKVSMIKRVKQSIFE